MLQKMWHKKWMNLCLLLGCILLVGTVVSFPLYREAALNRMLQDEFANYASETGEWPTLNRISIQSSKEKGGTTISRIEGFLGEISTELGVTTKTNICYYSVASAEYESEMKRSDSSTFMIRIGAISDMKDKIKPVNGRIFSDTGLAEDGVIEVVVSQSCLVEQNFLVGETIVATGLKLYDGTPIKLRIVGMVEPENEFDDYWQYKIDDMKDSCLMDYDLFHQLFTGENAGKYTISCRYCSLFEYSDIKAKDVDHIMERTNYLTKEGSYRNVISAPDYYTTLEKYKHKEARIATTLLILQIPVLAMLAAFLLMISGQMYEMERNEISVIKSRGSSGNQIFRLYLYQGIVITVVGGVLGLPLGAVFARILGATRNFLEFDVSKYLDVSYNFETLVYALAAMFITLLSITLPAIKHSRVSIVNLKQQKALKKKPLWEKLYLDIILILVSVYGYYSFKKDMGDLAKSVLAGESLDPLLYVSSSVFIVGLGLFFLRIQPLIVRLIYLIGKRFWGPASHVSFMENIKNGRKQQLIMLFLIMTISLGMYHATVARTILENAMENEAYLDGTDVIIKEVWTMIKDRDLRPTGEYLEPDYAKYEGMECAEHYTRVIVDDTGFLTLKETRARQPFTLWGIHTKNFGSITMVDENLIGTHYYNLLNELATVENGVLVSENFRSKLGYAKGDSVTYHNESGSSFSGTIVDFFSYFPGYAPTKVTVNPDGTVETTDEYLVVAHYDYLHSKFGTVPYEVWIGLKDGYTSMDVYNWLTDNKVALSKYVNRADKVDAVVDDPLLQGTNGVLTMGFVVTIILCAVGYLIYWVMSIRERELMFGVLRACGLHKSEVIHMILNEQLFAGVFSILAGIGIGKLTSYFFVPILQQAYASTDQVLPMEVITNAEDMFRLYGVIGGVVLVSLFVLIVLLFKMNVTKALKLGEE